ncbi:MAG: spermidine synthase, partial [Candidatus Omnitrophica bacterium]|nr:spermidine synthase [Candidatus Omnitrophota bacterium]MBD3268938.1 spermidine synthase [Candidatus Omnitrophota bacterium]
MWFYETLYEDIRLGLSGKLVAKKKTPYQSCSFYDTEAFGRVLLLDGIIQTTEKDEFIYHEMLTHPVMFAHPSPRRILIIGGGDGGVLREVLKHDPCEVVMVEIDKEI